MEKRKFVFQIFQLGKESDRMKRFEALPEGVDTVSLKDDKYEMVYEAAIQGTGDSQVLQDLFYIFNMAHPEDYRARSLSVSDIVKLNDKYYFCQPFGWQEIKVV